MTLFVERMTDNRTAWVAVAAYAAMLTYLLLTPHPLWFLGDSGRTIEDVVDRTVWGYAQHALAYSILGCLLVWASRSTSSPRQLLWMLLAMLHGLTAEWLQGFVPHRYADWTDGVANVLGIGLGWLAALLMLAAIPRAAEESVE